MTKDKNNNPKNDTIEKRDRSGSVELGNTRKNGNTVSYDKPVPPDKTKDK